MAADKRKKIDVAANSGVVREEYQLAGMILQEPGVIEWCDGLSPKCFADPNAGAIFDVAQRLYHESGAPVGSGLVAGEFAAQSNLQDEEASKIFHDLMLVNWGIPTEWSTTQLVKRIVSLHADREIAAAMAEGAAVNKNDGISAEEKLAGAIERLQKAQALKSNDRPIVRASSLFDLAMQHAEKAAANDGMPGIPTGFKELDNMLGGFSPAELIILAARPAMGKTAMALTIAHSAAVKHNKPTLLVSLEMDAEQVAQRWSAMLANIPVADIKYGRLRSEQIAALQEASADYGHVPFGIEETPSMTLSRICNKARQEHSRTEGGLGMLIVDYLQIVNTDDMRDDNRTNLVTKISGGLKQLSRELKIPVIALAQLNRGVENRQDKRPMMSDLRDSGAIEQDADVIMFLYRDEYYNPESIDKGRAEVIVAKQRNGGVGTVMVGFDGKYCRFTDLSQAQVARARRYG